MASLLVAAVFMAPLTYFAAIFLPVLWMKDEKAKKVTIQLVCGIIAVGLWAGVHHLAVTLYPGWWLVMAITNVVLVICALCVLAFIGADDLDTNTSS